MEQPDQCRFTEFHPVPFHFEDTGISAACFVTEDSEELNLFQ